MNRGESPCLSLYVFVFFETTFSPWFEWKAKRNPPPVLAQTPRPPDVPNAGILLPNEMVQLGMQAID